MSVVFTRENHRGARCGRNLLKACTNRATPPVVPEMMRESTLPVIVMPPSLNLRGSCRPSGTHTLDDILLA